MNKGSSFIAFQTEDFRQNFINCCKEHLLDCKADTTNPEVHYVQYKQRLVMVGVIPAGISFEKMSDDSKGEFSKECPGIIKELCETSPKKIIIVGVDRIDYTKGLPQKVQAFQSLLHQFPQFDGKAVYIQIAVPCRAVYNGFRDLPDELEKLVDKTNEELREGGFSSQIQLICKKVDQKNLAVLYKRADVALVTPLQDGMNLVAKEYVACQSDQAPGVLILSKFAGAAVTMEQALKVDPNDEQGMVDVLHDAINMDTDERQKRMTELKKTVQRDSAQRFVNENIRGMIESIEMNEAFWLKSSL